ncbi:unnamed protein product [Ostreobium quekettii]|uniref:Uncharacterized protein n=1 Tax=Ostreobium quekettii TaxID=121088 RepID=A0A8S1JGQ3_9CHLO|nr:unnamed protein product [Ostreobium quekettii]
MATSTLSYCAPNRVRTSYWKLQWFWECFIVIVTRSSLCTLKAITCATASVDVVLEHSLRKSKRTENSVEFRHRKERHGVPRDEVRWSGMLPTTVKLTAGPLLLSP